MIRIVVFLTGLLMVGCLFAQQDTAYLNKQIASLKVLADSNPLAAINESDHVLEQCQSVSYHKGLAEVYNLRGIILFNRGINDIALQNFIQSLDHYKQNGDIVGMSLIYNNLGVVSYTVKKYYYAIFFFEQSLAIQRGTGNLRNTIDLYNNIGSIYEKLKQYDRAKSLHFRANKMASSIQYHLGLSSGYNNLGVIYENTGFADSAVYYYRKALDEGFGVHKAQLSLTHSNLARTFLKSGRDDLAKQHLDSALDLALWSGAASYLEEIYHLFSQYYEEKGNLGKAYEYLKKYTEVGKINEEQTTEGDFADFILSLQQSRWQKERELLDREFALQRQLQWLLIILIVISVIVFMLLYLAIKNRNKLLDQRHRLAESESLRLSEELKNKELIAQLEKEQLSQEIRMKERQLTSMTMHIVTKNETLQEIEKHVDLIASGQNGKDMSQPLSKIRSIIKMNAGDDAVWNNYFFHFEQVYPGFFSKLSMAHSDLTQGEQKLCAYIIINLSNKEIAHVMGISEASIKIKKNRLAKKLKLENASDLTSFLRSFISP